MNTRITHPGICVRLPAPNEQDQDAAQSLFDGQGLSI